MAVTLGHQTQVSHLRTEAVVMTAAWRAATILLEEDQHVVWLEVVVAHAPVMDVLQTGGAASCHVQLQQEVRVHSAHKKGLKSAGHCDSSYDRLLRDEASTAQEDFQSIVTTVMHVNMFS